MESGTYTDEYNDEVGKLILTQDIIMMKMEPFTYTGDLYAEGLGVCSILLRSKHLQRDTSTKK